ncbi:putative zinc-type alcohol dehydrogenase-like protein [Colletotrichum acutatum]|uniref:Zinc-type alcohol dehydrogenase-like protein n=1 Tax=Glomerella acutata TaxID=27357 RepID=A0AAD8UIJ9_GLOAC|nr:putative zinc-type alcohol dehydrogenase-like protein [Colletotrichum acutatum]KAK1723888.1 putative zinc-type alcohol dehydrogenase-like protein [Colletotrichum acutatum]
MSQDRSQAWRIRNHAQGVCTDEGIDQNLSLEEVPKPSPKEGQVLVRIHATSLNYRDLLVVTSDPVYLGGGPDDGIIPLGDAGQTQAVFDIKVGLGGKSIDGVLQQYAVFDDDALAPLPSHLSFEEAAALSGPYVSAWNALFGGPQQLKKRDTVVIQGTGGVSVAGIQIAVAAGADVIAFSTSEEKLDLLRKLGAKHVISYKNMLNWSREVLDLTGGRGADQVLDVVGASTIVESLRALRQDGLVSAIGFMSASEKHDLIPELIFGAKTIRGLMYGSLGMLQDLSAFVEKHEIRPIIAEAYEWKDAKLAYKAMLAQEFVGKIVIKVE